MLVSKDGLPSCRNQKNHFDLNVCARRIDKKLNGVFGQYAMICSWFE